MSRVAEQRVAGHIFTDEWDAVCTGMLPNGERCCRTWAEIEHTTREQINQPNIAHIGNLNEPEYKSIVDERERREALKDRMMSAIYGICSP
jgi:hypothetical protein